MANRKGFFHSVSTAALVTSVIGSIQPAKAQVVVEMSRITCPQFLQYSFDDKKVVGAWMSGYFNASLGRKVLDITRYQANSNRVINYCKTHKNETLMGAIRKVAS
jgi:acid stress chaperone HdeB